MSANSSEYGLASAFRVIVQFVASHNDAGEEHYRVIAYREKTALGPVKFYSADDLLQAFRKAEIPELHLSKMQNGEPSATGIVFAGELNLASRQLQILGLRRS